MPGALPAYSAETVSPISAPYALIVTFELRLTAAKGFKPPVAHGGSIEPKPVPQTLTYEPGAAGFDGLFTVPSWFAAAACDETPSCDRKIPGAAPFTGTVIEPTREPLYCTWMVVDAFPLSSNGARTLTCRDCT